MKLTSEQIHKICNLQHKVMICKIYLKDSTGLYTSERIGEMFDDLELLSKMDNYLKELNEFLTTVDVEDVKETFSDKEFLQLPENKFTFDLQREATKEVIGRALTLEEVMEKVGALQ